MRCVPFGWCDTAVARITQWVTLLADEEGDARHRRVGREGERKVEPRALAGRQDHVATEVERCIGAAAVGIEAVGIGTGVAAVPRQHRHALALGEECLVVGAEAELAGRMWRHRGGIGDRQQLEEGIAE
jgi:hypothetical protein